jgi:hypothetical protein
MSVGKDVDRNAGEFKSDEEYFDSGRLCKDDFIDCLMD